MEQIESYKMIPVGKAKDITGQIFGDFKILYRTEAPLGVINSSKNAYWLCQCIKCNKYIIKSKSSLSSNKNQCNCKFNLTGLKFGRLTVLYKKK